MGIKFLIAGFIVLCSAVFMIHEGQQRAESGVDLGILLFFGGLLIVAIGAWLGFWGPLSSRNTTRGLQFILIGLPIIAIGILALSDTGLPFLSNNDSSEHHDRSIDWEQAFSHRMGPIPFGLFCLVVFIGANGLALGNKLSPGKALGTNLVVIALLLIAYALGPKLFANW
jgi:cytochrome c biogenesis protein CcdA